MIGLIKIGVVFFVILFLTFKKVKLWMSLLVDTFLLGFLFRLPLTKIIIDLISAVRDEKTLLLLSALVVGLLKTLLIRAS